MLPPNIDIKKNPPKFCLGIVKVPSIVQYKCELTLITVILNHIQWLLERNKLQSLQFRSIAEWRSLCLRPGDNHWHISSLHQGGNYVCAVSNGRHLFQDNIKAKWLAILRKHVYLVVEHFLHEKYAILCSRVWWWKYGNTL